MLEGKEERLQQNSHVPLEENMLVLLQEKPSQISSQTHLAAPALRFFNCSSQLSKIKPVVCPARLSQKHGHLEFCVEFFLIS